MKIWKEKTNISIPLTILSVAGIGLAVTCVFSSRIAAFTPAIETNREEIAADFEAMLGRCRRGAQLVGLLFIVLLIISVANLLILQTSPAKEITEIPDNKLSDCGPQNGQPPFSDLYPWRAMHWAAESLIRKGSRLGANTCLRRFTNDGNKNSKERC